MKTTKFSSSLSVMALCIMSLLTACGGGGGGGGGGSGSTTSVGVTPALGAFSAGATVEAFKTDGTALLSTPATTNASGQITGLEIPTSYTDALILRVKGGTGVTYFDEGKNAQVSLAATDSIISVLPAGVVAANAKFGVTPFTSLAAGLAGVDSSGATPKIVGNASDANAAVTAAFDKVKALTGLVDFDLTQAPNPLSDLTSTRDATSGSDLYGVMLAELAKAAGAEGALAQAKNMFQAGKSAQSSSTADDFVTKLAGSLQTVQSAMDQMESSSLLTNKASSDVLKKVINASAVAVQPRDLYGTSNLSQLINTRKTELTTQVTLRASKPLSDLEGIWDTSVNASLSGSGLITPDGRLLLRLQPSTTTSRIVVAQFKPTSDGYSATGVDLLLQDDTVTSTDVSLTITQLQKASTLTLTISKTDQAAESFDLTYGTRYESTVSVADFAGTWSDIVGSYAQVTWVINATGGITGTSSSSSQCAWVGKVTKRNEAKGVANVVVKETCGDNAVELKGLATFKAGSNKSVARVTLMNDVKTKLLLLELTK